MVLHGWCRRSVDCGGFYGFTWLVLKERRLWRFLKFYMAGVEGA